VKAGYEKGIEYNATKVAVEVGKMRIRCTNTGTREIYVPKIEDTHVVFSKNGFAVVSDRLGSYLVRKCPAIEEVKPEKIKKKKARTTAKGRGKKAHKEGE